MLTYITCSGSFDLPMWYVLFLFVWTSLFLMDDNTATTSDLGPHVMIEIVDYLRVLLFLRFCYRCLSSCLLLLHGRPMKMESCRQLPVLILSAVHLSLFSEKLSILTSCMYPMVFECKAYACSSSHFIIYKNTACVNIIKTKQ